MSKGVLIVIDGSNGAGKTTVMKAIEQHLSNKGADFLITREPGGTPLAEEIRGLLLSKRDEKVDETAELLLFAAARAQHVNTKIKPAIAASKIVLTDRFHSATTSFQGYGRGLSLSLIRQLRDVALGEFREDMNIILDLCPEEGAKRIRSRGGAPDRFDDDKMEFLHKARNGYLQQAKDEPERYAVIDASQPVEKVITDVIAVVDRITG